MTNVYIDPAGLRLHVPGLAIGDVALGELLDEIASEIDDRFGLVGSATEVFRPGDWNGPLILRRKAASITSATEYLGPISGDPETRILAADDYLLETPYRLLRLRAGTTPAIGWSRYGVSIAYVPVDDTLRRKMAIVAVVEQELSGSRAGLTSRSIGDYSESFGGGANGKASDPSATRTRTLRQRLAPRRGFVMR